MVYYKSSWVRFYWINQALKPKSISLKFGCFDRLFSFYLTFLRIFFGTHFYSTPKLKYLTIECLIESIKVIINWVICGVEMQSKLSNWVATRFSTGIFENYLSIFDLFINWIQFCIQICNQVMLMFEIDYCVRNEWPASINLHASLQSYSHCSVGLCRTVRCFKDCKKVVPLNKSDFIMDFINI